jgi:hypothetical protein
MATSERPVTTCLWQRVEANGLERFELLRGPDAWRLRGTILVADEGAPLEARYEILCDGAWRTRRAEVALRDGAGERTLALVAGDGRWDVNGREEPSLRGCHDVDLAWTPSTNTLPIRRLALPVGAASGEVVAAWVRFPELRVEPLPQAYAHLDERRWRYTSAGGAFTAVLDVDGDGVVIDYQGFWRRVGAPR